MSFNPGDRVRTIAQVGSIPAGSAGTVATSGPATSGVRFDIRPANVVVVPNHLLAPAGGADPALAERVFAATSLDDGTDALPEGFVWLSPRALQPQVASPDDIIATTTGGALSVLFEGATVALRRRKRSGAWFGLAEFPVSGGPAKVVGQLRGDVVQGKDAYSTIIVTIGSTTMTFEIAGAASNAIIRDVGAVVETDVVPIGVTIISSRRSNDEETLISIDSLDLAAQ